MKKILLSLALCLGLAPAFAQMTINASYAPVVGKLNIQATDTVPTISEGSAGASQSWDFSSSLKDQLRDTSVFLNPANTPFATSYPSANLATGQGGRQYTYLQSTANSVKVIGNTLSVIDTNIYTIDFNPAQTIVKFPSTYLSSFNETSGFNFKAYFGQNFGGTQIDSIHSYHNVVASVKYDAYGTVKTPAYTFNNCLREKRKEIRTDSISVYVVFFPPFGQWFNFQASTDTTLTYSWYAPNTKNVVAKLVYVSDTNGVMVKTAASYLPDTNSVQIPTGPIAIDDNRITPMDQPIAVDVQNNDILTGSVQTMVFEYPNNGTFQIFNNDSIEYTPNTGFTGKDSLSYRITDSYGQSADAKLRILVGQSGPLAVNDYYSTLVSTAGVISVQANDFSSGTLVTSIITGPVHGAASVISNTNISYTPTAAYLGPDSLTYQVCEGVNCDIAKVYINVYNESAPTVINDFVVTISGQFVIADVQKNDVSITALTTTVGTLGAPLHGTYQILNSDSIKYIPNAGFVGMDSLTYTVCNMNSGCTNGKLVIRVDSLINPVGIANIKRAINSVYPNPSSSIVNIQTDGKAGLFEVFDLTGRKMESLKIEGKTSATFNVSGYTEGIYIYKTLSPNGTVINTGKLSVVK